MNAKRGKLRRHRRLLGKKGHSSLNNIRVSVPEDYESGKKGEQGGERVVLGQGSQGKSFPGRLMNRGGRVKKGKSTSNKAEEGEGRYTRGTRQT